MDQKKDICPHCGGTDTITAKSNGQGAVFRSFWSFGKPLHHIICLNCGTIIRSYIEYPQDWA